ncbi:hypothetical protein C8F04DRAFT_1174003 [Mycena alexandri]|uniref:Uncharacterized protein n=1 Tax=Mycena alexandri TaxID=1745969 RepID=A0AAD6TGP8_9AGAR|nr:hypothetical protein C8F04DRAFT_1174003 [Mycena alexandri]
MAPKRLQPPVQAPAADEPPRSTQEPRATRRQTTLARAEAAPAPPRVRASRPGSRTANLPQEDPHPPTRETPAADRQALGFAPLTDRSAAPAAPSSSSVPRTPARSAANTPMQLLTQTPARAVANRLLSQLNQQTQMASPGPPLRNFSDGSDSDLDQPAPQPRVPRLRMQPLNALHTESDDEAPLPNPRPSRARTRGTPQSPQTDESNPWSGYQIDQAQYAWASDAFFGLHIEHRGFKCKLCPQTYSTGSSLTTRRKHLAKEHLTEYLELIAARKLPNKLPEVLRKERDAQRARNMQRIPFSIAAFEEKLAQVVVSNDLSINLIENREFRDLLLLLRESLRDEEIPHRTKLRSLILDAWLKYYDSLKKELKMGHFTMDNASNNATFMTHLSILLAERGLDFDADQNYIHCFAHIINLCSQAVIRAMEKQDSRHEHPETETETESDENTGHVVQNLGRDVTSS